MSSAVIESATEEMFIDIFSGKKKMVLINIEVNILCLL